MAEPRWTYVADHKRPHVHPLRTPSGAVLTRDAPDDHPWHHGLWFTIKYVNGENFWETYDAYGVLRHVDDTTIHWIRPDRETVVLVETCVLTEVDLGADDAYALDWDVTLVPPVDVVLDRTPFTTWGGYGGLTLRGRGDWTDTRLLLSDGSAHDRVLGTPGDWLDVSGTVDGGAAGALLLHHPSNPRHPVEFRLWNATRVGWRLHLAVGVSVALIECAVNNPDSPSREDERPLVHWLNPYLTDESYAAILRHAHYRLEQVA